MIGKIIKEAVKAVAKSPVVRSAAKSGVEKAKMYGVRFISRTKEIANRRKMEKKYDKIMKKYPNPANKAEKMHREDLIQELGNIMFEE